MAAAYLDQNDAAADGAEGVAADEHAPPGLNDLGAALEVLRKAILQLQVGGGFQENQSLAHRPVAGIVARAETKAKLGTGVGERRGRLEREDKTPEEREAKREDEDRERAFGRLGRGCP